LGSSVTSDILLWDEKGDRVVSLFISCYKIVKITIAHAQHDHTPAVDCSLDSTAPLLLKLQLNLLQNACTLFNYL
jgi:hypothetical protein